MFFANVTGEEQTISFELRPEDYGKTTVTGQLYTTAGEPAIDCSMEEGGLRLLKLPARSIAMLELTSP